VRSAFLYLTACSFKNRVVRRVRRLKEPRYLAGAVAGSVYVYFAFIRSQMRSISRSPRAAMGPVFGRVLPWIEAGGGMVLWLVVVLRWIFPSVRPPLQFNGAEVQFLFPAPVSRRSLVHFKVLRGQIGVLFSSVIALVLGGRSAPSRLSFVLGLWVLLATLRLHLMAIGLSRASLTEPGGRRRVRAWLPLAITVGASVALVGGLAIRLGPLLFHETPEVIAVEFLEQSNAGIVGVVLWPLKALVRPLLAEWPWPFLRALWVPLLLFALNYVWVLASDARLEEAAIASERRRSEGRGRAPVVTVRSAPFALASSGRPELAILWKNLLMLGRYFSVRNVIRFSAPLIALALAAAAASRGHSGGLTAAAFVCLVCAAMTPLLGPQMVRNDLRSDLAQLPILKTWPLSGQAIIMGELLAPALLVSGFAWLCILLASLLSVGIAMPALSALDRAAIAIAALLAIPGVVVAQLVIQNGAAVLFPGWIVTGPTRPRGIEAMGQQMLLFAGTMLLLAIGVLPAGAVAAMVGFVLRWFIGWVALVPAAMLFVAVLAAESWVAIHGLGRVFERTDPSAVEASE
jgi:ABC-2 type transport system permease protein